MIHAWTPEQERAAGDRLLAARAAGDTAALRRLSAEYVAHNMGLVYEIAKRFAHRGMDRDDLAQEGALGLMRAAATFDPARGFKFSTYASWWVRHHMQRACDDRAGMVHVPVWAKERVRRVVRQRARFRAAAGRDPDAGELAALTGCTADEQAEVERTARLAVSSLDDPVLGDGTTRVSMLAAAAPDATDELRADERRAFARRLLEALPDRERFVLERRVSGGEETLADIARDFDLSRERVRQIEASAIARLQALARVYRLEAP